MWTAEKSESIFLNLNKTVAEDEAVDTAEVVTVDSAEDVAADAADSAEDAVADVADSAEDAVVDTAEDVAVTLDMADKEDDFDLF